MAAIPVVDYLELTRYRDGSLEGRKALTELHRALSTIGFVYVVNHEVEEQILSKVFETSKEFFGLPLKTKLKYLRTSNEDNSGYVQLEQERLEEGRPPDLKECFNITGRHIDHYPVEVKLFQETVKSFFDKCLKTAMQLLEIIGHALELEDPQFFIKAHSRIGEGPRTNCTALRLLHYPAITEVKANQLRCGEHTDYGSITLLFQDENGGLEVKRADGSYILAPFIKGAVLVNLGALMQQWTADNYLATPHRVLIPSNEAKNRVRNSLAFFVHPDNDELITAIDGSNKYPPITAAEYLAQQFAKSYGK